MPDKIVFGSRRRRKYLDASGRPISVGDFVSYVIRSGSSVYLHFGRIKELIDTDAPAYVGYGERLDPNEPAPRVESWDYAYKLKLIPYEYDRLHDRWHLHKSWDNNAGKWVEPTSEDDVKVRSIQAIDRVLRLDVNV